MIPIPRAMKSSTPSSKRSTRHAVETETGILPEREPVLADTDMASALYLQRYYGRRVTASLAGTLATRRLAISLITLGEAHYGARKRKWGPPRTSRMLTFYSASRSPNNDLWIAACATANGLPLATLNRRHFEPLTIFGLTLL
jgi:predicted nucleic acid-binding protein